MNNIQEYKAEFEDLVSQGQAILKSLHDLRDTNSQETATKLADCIKRNYQSWYTVARIILQQLLPDRLNEFDMLYNGEGLEMGWYVKNYPREEDHYSILYWIRDIPAPTGYQDNRKYFEETDVVIGRMAHQLDILHSVAVRFDSKLTDIRQRVQADLFDSELDAARELNQQGFSRAAGAMAGVVLERHLRHVADRRKIEIRKERPTISDLNDLLKKSTVLDIPVWRRIAWCGDIRNLCVHSTLEEPSSGQVNDLINYVDQLTHTLL